MAGVTDRPFRSLCKRLGAGLAVSEMTASSPDLWNTRQSRLRRNHQGEKDPISVQIAGFDPEMMAEAARLNEQQGAQIIDINMGCPAKKVCKVDAGSALMKDEALVERILTTVVGAVSVPVTLKIRTGWERAHRNGPTIAHIAEQSGIACLAVHGRTREDQYKGQAEYDTIALIKQNLSIPVLANGDIDCPEKARQVLNHTGADGLMIGRAALGRPWVFRDIARFLSRGTHGPAPSPNQIGRWLQEHVNALHEFYGEAHGVRIARKHIKWYCQSHPDSLDFWQRISRVDSAATQLAMIGQFFMSSENSSCRAA